MMNEQFGILEYPWGYTVTAITDPSIVYASIMNDGSVIIDQDEFNALPLWHQLLLVDTLNVDERAEMTQDEYVALKPNFRGYGA